jgi:chlorobactene glucosyltransferase
MYTPCLILTIVAGCLGFEWLMRNFFALKVWRKAYHLRADEVIDDSRELPPLSVVVAAKDEENNIRLCLDSLLQQDYPNFTVTVANDRSSDKTADIVREIMDRDDRLNLVQIDTLPDGWCGKNHAMQRGIETTDAPWIFMTDADCRQICPRSLRLAMHHALDEKADMITLLPVLSMQCFWERFLLPICAGILMIWFRPSRINDADKDHAYANGMFMMIRRDAYDEIGQHEAMAGSLMEDMDMARKIKQAGRRLVMTPTEGLFDVWMYNSGRALYWGWVRIFVGAFRSLRGLMGALLLLIARGLGLTALTIVGWSLASAGNGYQTLAWVATAGLACQLVMTARYYVHIKSKWWWGVLYPIPCLMVAFILVRAMFVLRPGAQILWRGTRYKLQS